MRLRQLDFHKYATVVVVAGACLVLVPPLAIDGRLTHLEFSLVLLVLSMVLAVVSPRPPTRLFIPSLLFALLGLMAVSGLWSVDTTQTARDAITFLALAVAAVLLVHSSPLSTLVAGVALSGAILLLWSLGLVVFSPDTSFNSVGALVGPYGNRNGLAYALLQSLPAAIALAVRSRWGLVVKLLFASALCIAIFATLSRTMLLVMIVVLFTGVAIALMKRNPRWGLALGPIAIGAVAVAAVNFGSVLALLGKSESLNGRTQIWDSLLSVAAQRPLTGYGWSLSWHPQGIPSMAVTRRLEGVVVYHAHNELLNWMVTTGAVGVVLIISVYAFIMWRGIRVLPENTPSGSWILLGAVVLLARGISDISETLPQGWFILAVLAAGAAQSLASSSDSRLSRVLAPGIPLVSRRPTESENGSVVA